ncbi:TonB-dependent receptor [Opitutus terrae]|uniref:Oar protein n=1 Tax=Opitutus terrae (strain DSM 11246 / JCM 15787 / PB90-1) TaxID=452637 RepID=B1ZN65_OPITP|nr:TonB-dependent receptor [Opitutus terrae]ACB73434.1 Oar protein [Opitutus terrae PB90-1]
MQKLLKLVAFAGALIGLLSHPAAFAQVITTSSLSGTVVNESGNAVPGASVVIVHQPTGVITNATTRADGNFAIRGLRPGGPYSVTVTAEAFAANETTDIYLDIDRGANLAIRLKPEEAIKLEKYTVTASAIEQLFDPTQTGSGTYATSRELDDLPSGDRSINSLARLDPRITYNRDPYDRAISVNGMSNRYNLIQVDGVNASDPFGLNANNTAAERNVVPMDSLEALAISTSPYNARNAGFVGARINAITKSGTNEFHGALTYSFRGNSVPLPIANNDLQLVGDELDGRTYNLARFEEQTWGATLGGPIIKNRLFFYLAYEKVDEDRVAPTPTTRLDSGTVAQIVAKAQELGFEPGSAEPPAANKLTDENLLAKIDWQINANHRATFRYNTVESSRPSFPLFGSGASQNNFSFDSDWYKQKTENTSYIGQLISRWSDRLNTEFSASRSEYHSEPVSNTRQPYVEIRNIPVAGSSNTAYVAFGTEYSRHFNVLDVESDTTELFATYELSDAHTLQAGLQYDNNKVFNAYVQYSLGYYRYNSLNDFLTNAAAGGASGQYQYNFIDPDVEAAARFDEGNAGLFINDNWRVTDTLSVDVGARIDVPLLPEDVPLNQSFQSTFGVRNNYTYDGDSIVQPRVGFNWQPRFDSKRTIIRGGVGLFYGRMPRVWLSNSYSNTGFNYVSYQSNTLPPISANPDNQPTSGTSPAQQVAFLDPGFKLPSRWKANLAIERELGFWNLKASAEIEATKVKNDVFYSNINLQPTGTGPDGRELYWASYAATSRNTQLKSTAFTNKIIRLGNTDEGATRAITFSLERPQTRDGWYWKASYVNTDAEEVLFGTSSVAASNWNNRSVFNANAPEKHTSELEVKHRILFNISKEFEFVHGYPTTVSTIYEGRSGYPFSFTYSGDANGDAVSGNDLLYVPTRGDTSAVRFATPADQENFYKIVDRFGLTEGRAVAADAQRYPWVNTFDFSIKQQVKLPGWKHRLVLGLDILNLGNLLNDKWGLIRGSNQFFVKRENVATVVYDGVAKQYVYSRVSTDLANNKFNPSLGRGEPAASRWSVLLTARYEF